MKMNTKLLWLFCLLFYSGDLRAMSDTDLRLLAQNRSGSADAIHALLGGLSSRDEAVKFLRDVRRQGSFRKDEIVLHPGQAISLLQSLGDKEELQNMYERFRTAPDETTKGRIFQKTIGQALHPAFIIVLGQDLGKNTEKVRLAGEVEGFEIPYANAVAILNIINRSRFFAPPVEAWAHTLEEKCGWDHPELYLAEIRAFWAENAERIEAGEYALVRPPSLVSAAKSEEPSPHETIAPSPVIVSDPKLANSSETVPVSTPPTEQPSAKESKSVWWIVGLIIFAGGVVFTVRKKKPNG